jgi:beta-galactosidase
MKIQKVISNELGLSTFISLIFALAIGFTSCKKQAETGVVLRTISFDNNWRFLKDSLTGAENPGFDDSGWRILDVPHDWSIEDLPGQDGVNIIGPFYKNAIDKMSSGYTVGGIAWYRKTFAINEEDKDKVSWLQFDGVCMNADVWLNGTHLGFHPYGYTPFYFNITPYLYPPGQKNVVAVRVRNEGINSRWYSGSGINRHVWLTLANPVHIDVSGGIYVTTTEVSQSSADVKVVTTLVNSGDRNEKIILRTELIDPSGKRAGSAANNSSLAPGQSAEVIQNIRVNNPSLWSIDDPNNYNAKVSVLIDDNEVDNNKATFGIRSVKMDARNGLSINGKTLDLIGGCYHHDNGPLGAASIDRAEERKIEILRRTGFNAIRTSHNPPSPALLDACDRLGMVVIDEIFDMWETPKREE